MTPSAKEVREKVDAILYDVENNALNDPTADTNKFVQSQIDLIMGIIEGERKAASLQALETARADVDIAYRWNRNLKEILNLMDKRIAALQSEGKEG